ncbi:MAG TPA: recombinase family protein [Candidatus Saccharimonadales bacterium]|nr:recombinase family protein [Candidatus Saccharimonadales bacterium]
MSRSLPASLDAVSGLRAARWFRESTTGQFDNFGPDAQRDQQDRAMTRYGLVDSGLEWSVAASGWKDAWRTPPWQAMLAAARSGAFDVLVVGYASRFLRNLKQTLIAVEDHLQPAGVVVLFADERLLSSDPDHWSQFVREAQESEAFSRKQSKRVHEGYEQKRRRLGIPGGNRAPYGVVREGHPSTLRLDEPKAAVVREAYQLAAAGCTDWEVAAKTGLAKTHIAEILTNPVYMGQLRTGEPAGVAPIVEPALYCRVQTARERRRTRTPGRVVQRDYALRLRCAGCGKYLYGDVGRYRHPAPTCEAFVSAKPSRPRTRGHRDDARIKGHSYPQAWYEDAVGAILERIGRVDDATISEVVRLHSAFRPRADELTLARIHRAKEEAARTFARTRDLPAFQATLTRLDAEERIASEPVEVQRLTATEIVDYTRSLPRLWADAGPHGRQALIGAIFARLDVLGFQRLEYELAPDAIDLGLDAALPRVLELESKIGEFGRGERI